MLFLVVYKRPAGYVDGEVSIGIFDVVDGEEAKRDAIAAIVRAGWSRPDPTAFSVAPLGSMLQIADLPSRYDG